MVMTRRQRQRDRGDGDGEVINKATMRWLYDSELGERKRIVEDGVDEGIILMPSHHRGYEFGDGI